MMNRRLIIVFLTFALLLTLGVVQAQDATVVQIFFPIAVDSPVTEILNGYAEAYEAEHSGVDIQWSFEGGYADVKIRLLTVKEGGGDLPALAIMLATDIYDLVNAEAVQSWDAFASDEYLADFTPTWLSNSYYDYDGDGTGELYGLPFQRSTVLLYYNADLLDEAGLSVPANWDELASAAQALTTDAREGILIPNSLAVLGLPAVRCRRGPEHRVGKRCRCVLRQRGRHQRLAVLGRPLSGLWRYA
ncbi:MAG: extracellular solute-binding protein [Chloroflexi bacterium]|nr:extracellular solute-binding protein [Chloroflexota bacterium]